MAYLHASNYLRRYCLHAVSISQHLVDLQLGRTVAGILARCLFGLTCFHLHTDLRIWSHVAYPGAGSFRIPHGEAAPPKNVFS